MRIFAESSATKKVWGQRIYYFRNTLDLPDILPQSALFGFLLVDKVTFQIKNLILLLFKIYLWIKPWSFKMLIFTHFEKKIKKLIFRKKIVEITMKQKKTI